MPKNFEDRRARRSRKLLKESLLELMKHKTFSDISVRDVTDAADMNRGTFYLHYSGTAELLQSLEADLLSELQELIDAHMQETVAVGSVVPVFEPVLDFVAGRRETCAVLFNSSEASGFIQALQQLICQNGAPLVKTWFHPQDPRLTGYLLNFLAWGLIGLLKEWFDQDMTLSQAELTAAAQRMAEGAAANLFQRA
ncbi:MAG: TetR/AcrR family transcriptional regulator [Oscillibacter sp.]|jgi:AcrR family transcriptional regulator|nr:TetR/AcrR family transcriptional regulator [Oscillibacter sp.]MCI8690362.1 TetR/AcrR family transcriptional regulator [Oscillibacter sp.]MCI9482148.1 TetR/AcrR family transcriptional regulator [Oscillibacter sp.]